MELTSEQVHWLGGAAFVIVIGLLLAHHAGALRHRWVPWLLPTLLVGYGIESGLDWWIHGDARPEHYLPQALQHVMQGSAVLLAGLVEGARLRGRLQAVGWGYVLPAALTIVGVAFWAHSQHGAQVDPTVMMVQHRGFAVALVTAALMRTLEIALLRRGVFEGAWLAPLLIFGGLLLVYTESDSMTGMDHSPAAMSSTHRPTARD